MQTVEVEMALAEMNPQSPTDFFSLGSHLCLFCVEMCCGIPVVDQDSSIFL